jgi:hypothetical protein
MDEPIGDDKLQDFLWEYHNSLIRHFLVYSLGIIDDQLKLQGKPTVGEQMAADMNIPVYYQNNDEATGQTYMSPNQRALFNFILTDEHLYNEWISFSYQNDNSKLDAFLHREWDKRHKKIASTTAIAGATC